MERLIKDNMMNKWNKKYATEKQAADVGQVVQGLGMAAPFAVALGDIANQVKNNIVQRKRTFPAAGTEEAFAATGIMSPEKIKQYKEDKGYVSHASLEERYIVEKTSGLVDHLPMIDALGHGAKAVADTVLGVGKGLVTDLSNTLGHPGPHHTDAPTGEIAKSMVDLGVSGLGVKTLIKKAPAAIDALKDKLDKRRDQKATDRSWTSIQDSGILEDK